MTLFVEIPFFIKSFLRIAKKRGILDLTIDILYNILVRKNKVPYYLNRRSTIVSAHNLHLHPHSIATMTSLSVSPNIYIQCNNKVYIGKNVLIAPDVKIISSNHSKTSDRSWIQSLPIIINDDTWLGAGAIVLPAVTISEGITIGAGTIVSKSLCIPGKTYVGNPAKLVK